MKKGITFLLAFFLVTLVPTVSKAQEIENPSDTIKQVVKKFLSPQKTILNKSEISAIDFKNLHKDQIDSQPPVQSNTANDLKSKDVTVNSDTTKKVTTEAPAASSSIEKTPKSKNVPTVAVNQESSTAGAKVQDSDKVQPEPSLSTKELNNARPIQEETQSNNEESIKGLNLNVPVVCNVNLNLLSNETVHSDSGDPSSTKGELLGLSISNSMLLGNVSLDILPIRQDNTISGTGSFALVTADLSSPLLNENVNLNLLSNETSYFDSGMQTSTKGELLGVSINNSLLLGDLNLDILPIKQDPVSGSGSVALITADISSPLLDYNHIGVLEYQHQSTDAGVIVSGGLLIVDSNNTLLGGTHIGIGEFENITAIAQTDNSSSNSQQNPVRETPNLDGQSGENTGLNNPEQGMDPETKGNFQNTPFGSDETVKSSLSLSENSTEAILASQVEKTDSTAESINELTEAENKTLFITKMNNRKEFQKDRESKGDETADFVQQAIASGSHNSTSSSGGNAPSQGGPGIDSFIEGDYLRELALSSHVQFILKELSDEWVKAPPIKPPKTNFFFSV